MSRYVRWKIACFSYHDQTGKLFVERLILHTGSLEGPLPDSLYNLTHLKELFLNSNTPGFEGSIKTDIGNLKKLTHLALSNNPLLTGTLPTELGLCEDLSKTSVQSCFVCQSL